jgi:hypothetical protein
MQSHMGGRFPHLHIQVTISTSFRLKFMDPVFSHFFKLGSRPSILPWLLHCQKDGMRRPTTSICLNDVLCLLHIPIEGKMMRHEDQSSYDKGVLLMTKLLGVVEDEAMEETMRWWFYKYPLLEVII